MKKLKAIILIQIKAIKKYENFISILLSQIWGQEQKNKVCREYVFEYINMIEENGSKIGVITASAKKEHKITCRQKGVAFYMEKSNNWQKDLIEICRTL